MPLYLLLAADTLLVRQMPPDRTGFEQVVYVATGLAQVGALVVMVLLLLLFHRIWKAQQAMHDQLARLTSKVDPMIASATSAAENVRVLTDVVRRDAVEAAEALTDATARVRDSVSGIADRIDDFGDLLGRVHAKADAVADVAEAAINTVKWGARALRPEQTKHRHATPARPATPAPTRNADVDDDLDEPLEEPLEAPLELDLDASDDIDDVHDDSPYAESSPSPSPEPSAAARRRRRRRGRGRRPPAS